MTELKPNDFGPIYAETNMLHLPVEPWNTYSNLIFLFIIIYWIRKIHGNYRKHLLFSIGLPILAVGYTGGTIYHATRSHPVWLYLDFMPILILLTLTAFHLWYLYTGNMLKSLFALLISFLISYAVRKFVFLSMVWKISLGYSLSAALIILPALLLSLDNKRKNLLSLFLTVLFFAAAVVFRQLDKTYGTEIFPMGTHFLWHLCGGISVFYIMKFIYLFEVELQRAESTAS